MASHTNHPTVKLDDDIRNHLKKVFCPHLCVGRSLQVLEIPTYSSGLNFAAALIWDQDPNFEMTSNIISTWWGRMNCLICWLSEFYADSVSMAGLLISTFFTPPDNRAVSFWRGFKGLGIKFDVYFCSRLEGHF